MARKKYQSQVEAQARYEAKTYKKFTFYLRQSEDKAIIDSIQRAKNENITLRDWLTDVFNKASQ